MLKRRKGNGVLKLLLKTDTQSLPAANCTSYSYAIPPSRLSDSPRVTLVFTSPVSPPTALGAYQPQMQPEIKKDPRS